MGNGVLTALFLFFFALNTFCLMKGEITMDRIQKIMEKYEVDFEEAFEIMEIQDRLMFAFSNGINPYGKIAH